MADPQAPTGMMAPQGYGVNPSYQANQDKQWQLAAALASMPDSGLTNKLMNEGQPEGQMVSGVFVPPSITQQLSGVAGNALGAGLMRKRNGQAKDLIAALRDNAGGGGGGMGSNPMADMVGSGGGAGPGNMNAVD
jgi:hypothetical protein